MNVDLKTDAVQEVIIRSPRPHDVLCGRGGGINSHPGNQTFRNWVRENKEAYNLAANKIEKAKVSRDVLNQVANLPGRFLQREEFPGESSPVWVQIDDMKAMAKTSQALREGAPAIRAKAKYEPQRKKSKKMLAKNNVPKSEPSNGVNNVSTEVIPRSKSLTRMIAANMSEESPINRKKLNPKYETIGIMDVKDEIKNDEITDEEKLEKMQLNPDVPIFLDNVPPATNIKNDTERKGKAGCTNIMYDCVVVDPQNIVMSSHCHNISNQETDEASTTLTHCSSEQPTPTLLPVPAPTEPPSINSFPLPPSTFTTIPLSPTLYKTQPRAPEKFPPLISPTNEPQIIRSNSLARCELSNDIYTQTEKLLLRGTVDVDTSFSDPFTSDNEHFERAVEGNPDFSATGLGTIKWNTGILSVGSLNSKNLVRASSNVSTRSLSELSDLLADLPDLENELKETFEWNKGMNDIYVARDLDYNSDVTYLIPHSPLGLKRRMSNMVGTNKRQKLQVQ